jgi:hypothetical protein
MKKYLLSYIVYAAMGLPLADMVSSCSNEDYLGGDYSISEGAGTAVKITGELNASTDLSFQEGDSISVTATYGINDASACNRAYYYCDSTTFSVDSSAYPLYVKGNCRLVAYYPFTGTDGAEPSLTLNTENQSNITNYYFAKSDSLTKDAEAVHFNFVSAYAKFQFNITELDEEQISGYRLIGFSHSASVNPYDLSLALDAVEDLSGTGSNMETILLKMIPQSRDTTSDVVPQIVLIGKKRSYTIDLNSVMLTAGKTLTANVDVTNGIGTVEFGNNGGQWTDSGVGGDITSTTSSSKKR